MCGFEDKDSGIVYATYSLGQSLRSINRRRNSIGPINSMFFIVPLRAIGRTFASV